MQLTSDYEKNYETDSLRHQWNNFVAEHGPKSGAFLQSWEWGEFQKACGKNVFRFLITPAGFTRIDADLNADLRGSIQGVMQVIKMPLPMGKSYLYVPRGPIIISDFRFQISDLNKSLGDLARKEKAIFIKLELPIEKELFNKINLQSAICNLQSKSIQPKDTLILNLEKSEEDLLANMREKTRYNIRLAERKGVTVRWSEAINSDAAPSASAYRQSSLRGAGAQDLEKFWRLAQETGKRDRFSYHPKNYYREMLETPASILPLSKGEEGGGSFRNNLIIKMVIAEKEGELLAANIVAFFGNTATYLHGASNYARRELMAPHLLQWRAIQEAKKLGYKYYDFWGISPVDCRLQNAECRMLNHGHPWAGITRFKLGFGGEVISCAPSLDFPVNKFWYKIYRLAKRLAI